MALPNVPVRARWAGGEGYACITSVGVLGSCQPFMKCYPYFKAPPQGVRFPVLNAWDSWVLGNRDTCNYYTNDGREAHGVCCTNPITPAAPGENEGSEQNKIDLPVQTIQNWPPQIPTHPPDHAAPTHPPSHFGGVQPVTDRPFATTTTRRTTTWATRPPQPIFGNPAQTTSKRPQLITTENPIINDVTFDGGACGGKNGFQVI